jgi:hypothetical protein
MNGSTQLLGTVYMLEGGAQGLCVSARGPTEINLAQQPKKMVVFGIQQLTHMMARENQFPRLCWSCFNKEQNRQAETNYL